MTFLLHSGKLKERKKEEKIESEKISVCLAIAQVTSVSIQRASEASTGTSVFIRSFLYTNAASARDIFKSKMLRRAIVGRWSVFENPVEIGRHLCVDGRFLGSALNAI
jgi:hypothetical protein